MLLRGMFVNEDGGVRYAWAIVHGNKKAETRTRDMLKRLVGQRVAVIRTRRGKNPEVVGFVTITRKEFVKKEDFAGLFNLHLVPPGSGRDCTRSGKWFYYLEDPEPCDPYPLPADAVRHGRSWCEFVGVME